jgi:hypothetical protein
VRGQIPLSYYILYNESKHNILLALVGKRPTSNMHSQPSPKQKKNPSPLETFDKKYKMKASLLVGRQLPNSLNR